MKMWFWTIGGLQTIWNVIVFIWRRKEQISRLVVQVNLLKAAIQDLRREIRFATEDQTITKEEAEKLFNESYLIINQITEIETSIKELLKEK